MSPNKLLATTTFDNSILTYGTDVSVGPLGTMQFELGSFKGSIILPSAPKTVTVWNSNGGFATMNVTVKTPKTATGGGGPVRMQVGLDGDGPLTDRRPCRHQHRRTGDERQRPDRANPHAGIVLRCKMRSVPLHLVRHPIVQDVLMTLRDARTPPLEFRRAAERISLLLAAEALRDIPTKPGTVESPMGPADGTLINADVVVVPILRAGLGMLDAVLELMPAARVGYIGLQRDETTAVASAYYSKLPGHLAESYVLVVDPMLATGGSAVNAVHALKRAGAARITFLCLVAAPEGASFGPGSLGPVTDGWHPGRE